MKIKFLTLMLACGLFVGFTSVRAMSEKKRYYFVVQFKAQNCRVEAGDLWCGSKDDKSRFMVAKWPKKKNLPINVIITEYYSKVLREYSQGHWSAFPFAHQKTEIVDGSMEIYALIPTEVFLHQILSLTEMHSETTKMFLNPPDVLKAAVSAKAITEINSTPNSGGKKPASSSSPLAVALTAASLFYSPGNYIGQWETPFRTGTFQKVLQATSDSDYEKFNFDPEDYDWSEGLTSTLIMERMMKQNYCRYGAASVNYSCAMLEGIQLKDSEAVEQACATLADAFYRECVPAKPSPEMQCQNGKFGCNLSCAESTFFKGLWVSPYCAIGYDSCVEAIAVSQALGN